MRQGSTKLRVNDKVEIIAGKDKGRVGKVLRIERETNRILVERINLIKKTSKSYRCFPGWPNTRERGSNSYFKCYACLP